MKLVLLNCYLFLKDQCNPQHNNDSEKKSANIGVKKEPKEKIAKKSTKIKTASEPKKNKRNKPPGYTQFNTPIEVSSTPVTQGKNFSFFVC